MNQRFTLVWQLFSGNSPLASRFGIEGREGYVPFLVWGERLEKMERTRQLEGDDRMILFGLLVGWLDGISKPFFEDDQEDIMLWMLEVFMAETGEYQSLERFILDTALDLKDLVGEQSMAMAHRTGLHLFPESTYLKEDLITAIFTDALDNTEEITPEQLREIERLYSSLPPLEEYCEIRDWIIYVHICCLLIQGRRKEALKLVNASIGKTIRRQDHVRELGELLEKDTVTLKDIISYPST